MDSGAQGRDPGAREGGGSGDGLFREALDAFPFPAWIVGADGQVAFSNRAAARAFGPGGTGAVLPGAALGIARAAGMAGEPVRAVITVTARGDRAVQVRCEAIPLSPPSAGMHRPVVVAAHISGEGDPLLELFVRDLSRRKLRDLISAVRHDILNQLTVLIGFLQYSEDLCEDPRLREFIAKEEGAGKSIQSLIEFTRKFQDLATDEPAWIALSSLAAPREVQSLPPDLRLDLDCSGLEVYAGPLLATVFSTLVGNAVDHAAGLSRIAVTASEEGGDLVIAVEDDGPGIPPGEKRMLFERGHGRQRPGGYSLWLAREIVEACGGTLRECGEEGKGARFEIRIPSGLWRRERERPVS